MPHAPAGPRASLDDLGVPLRDVTFVIVDLETTGGRPEAEGITEIGAVKVRAGDVLGEFATLVDPGHAIPTQIEVLTGITTRMVSSAPRIASVLPQFLDFLGEDSVLVAHNAPFDVGFLKAAAAGLGLDWHPSRVVDTVRLARGLVASDEVPNHKLATLAALFGAETVPNHRALADARATVDVFHALLGRAGSLGVVGLDDLLTYSGRVPPRRRRKASLADGLPDCPGVYVFVDDADSPLFVGPSTHIKQSVRSYFTASELRRRMGEMVDRTAAVEHTPCATVLEAHVQALRILTARRPPYNPRSASPQRPVWLASTDELFPRLIVVRSPKDAAAAHIGPFRSAASAHQAREVVHAVRDVWQCSTSTTSPLVHDLEAHITQLTDDERFEDSRRARDGLTALLEGLDRAQRSRQLCAAGLFVAAHPRLDGGWEFAAFIQGRLASTAAVSRGIDPAPAIASLIATARAVTDDDAHAVSAEETDLILDWLEQPGTRIVECEQPWFSPVDAARPHLLRLSPGQERSAVDPEVEPLVQVSAGIRAKSQMCIG